MSAKAFKMNHYRKRIFSLITRLLNDLAAPASILDFGCGDGWFASQISNRLPNAALTGIDVKRRKEVLLEPVIYPPGDPLPFADASFDLVYAIDVLHHCDSPQRYLDELARVAQRYILIKDHTYTGALGYWALAILDELGNRRFGIPSPQHYQRGWEWTGHLANKGWKIKTIVHPCKCHTGLLGSLSNHLQYVALYERIEERFENEKLQLQ